MAASIASSSCCCPILARQISKQEWISRGSALGGRSLPILQIRDVIWGRRRRTRTSLKALAGLKVNGPIPPTAEHPRQGELYPEEAWVRFPNAEELRMPVAPITLLTAISISLATLEWLRQHGALPFPIPPVQLANDAHVFVGTPLGFLLALRLNNAYDRWKEGRLFFDIIILNLRLTAAQFALGLSHKDHDSALTECIATTKAFAISLRDFLRRDNLSHGGLALSAADVAITEDLKYVVDDGLPTVAGKKFEKLLTRASHPPWFILDTLRAQVKELARGGALPGALEGAIYAQVAEISRAVVGCERILTTRMPFSFVSQVRTILLLWLATLPLVLLKDLEPITAVVSHFAVTLSLMGLEAASIAITQPFGYDFNDLPINRLCTDLCSDIDEIVAGARERQSLLNELVGKE